MENLILYYKENSERCSQAIKWLKTYNLAVELREIESITRREIFQLIYLSDMDIPDILTKLNKYSLSQQVKRKYLSRLRFGESLIYLEKHSELLEVPIILSNEHSLSGYNEQKIQTFLT